MPSSRAGPKYSVVLAALKDEPSVALRAILDRCCARRRLGHHGGSTAKDGLKPSHDTAPGTAPTAINDPHKNRKKLNSFGNNEAITLR